MWVRAKFTTGGAKKERKKRLNDAIFNESSYNKRRFLKRASLGSI